MEFSNEIFRSLGMALLHSLWQGIVIAVMLFFLSGLIRKSNAQLRYVLLFSGLMLLLLGFITTFVVIYRHYYQSGIDSFEPISKFVPAIPARHLIWQTTRGFTNKLMQLFEPAYPVMAVGWFTGFILAGIRTTGGVFLSHLIIKKTLKVPDDSLQAILNRVLNELGLALNITLRVTDTFISPMVIGFLKPLIIIPAAAISGLSVVQIEAVLYHELAHIRRFDHILIFMQVLAGQVLFFHPFAWFLIREINRERENCCDDFVVKMNISPINYIKALTMIQEMNLQTTVTANAVTGMSRQLLNRVKRLVTPELKRSYALRLTASLLFFVTIGILMLTLVVTAKPQKQSDTRAFFTAIPSVKDVQDDTIRKTIMNETVSTIINEKKDGENKKMKIVFINDTIKEMTINGKSIDKEERKEYEGEISKIRQEMESSKEELKKLTHELEDAQKEIEIARKEIEKAKISLDKTDISRFNLQINGVMSQANNYMEQYRNVLQDDKFKENMSKVQEEYRKAFEELKIKQEEYWQSHQNEYTEQFRKARESAEKSFEEMRENNEPFYFYKPVPEIWDHFAPVPIIIPEFETLVLPDIEDLMPEIPENQLNPIKEELTNPKNSSTESLNLKLRELEEE